MQVLKCFPGGRHKALTMSWDDGRTADRRLVEIMNRHGLKGTFHLNSGLMDSPDRISAGEAAVLYAGHEVAAHTATHPTMARCPREQMVDELLQDRKNLEALVGYAVRGLSYPNGSHNAEVRALLPLLGFSYSRVVGGSRNFAIPENWYEWQTTCHHKTELLAFANEFVELFKKQYLYLMAVWGHSYEFDQDDNWGLIEEFGRLTGGRDDIWYATSIELVDYMDALDRLRFAASMDFAENPSSIPVWVSVDGLAIEVRSGERKGLSGRA